MDAMIRDFFLGFKDTQQQHHLYLKSWKTICLPKQAGGLGIGRMRDLNQALLLKLAWRFIMEDNSICLQLIWAKYLRGRRLLEVQHLLSPASWIWNGITHVLPLLRSGLCYQVAEHSNLRIREDPWLYKADHFRIPDHLDIPTQFKHVKDLMCADGKTWNSTLVANLFPHAITDLIMDTPIVEMEQDRPVWYPSSSGKFSVKDAYKWRQHGDTVYGWCDHLEIYLGSWNSQ